MQGALDFSKRTLPVAPWRDFSVSFDLLRVVVGRRVFLRLLRIGSAATMVPLTRLYRMWMLPAKGCARFSAQTGCCQNQFTGSWIHFF
jgi:hypothetical protein